MERFNRADLTLALVTGLFVVLLIAKVSVGYNFWLEGAFFCTEAALVGGIADWFAVTALFKRPLGFPYHTALIPRKREQLVENCIHLVQREFFSRKSLITRLKKEDLLQRLIEWLETANGRSLLHKILLEGFSGAVAGLDTEARAAELAERFRRQAAAASVPELTERVLRYLKNNGYENRLLERTIDEAEAILAQEATRLKIIAAIQGYIEEQSKNPLFALMFMFAKSTDVLNFEEAADIIQSELVKAVGDLRRTDNQLRLCILDEMENSLASLKTSETAQQCFSELRDDVLATVDIKRPIKLFLDKLLAAYKTPDEAGAMAAVLDKLIASELGRIIDEFKNNQAMRQQVDSYIYDLTGRAILQAQALLGIIVKTAMKRLSDEELNELIYSKVEPDLLWIRMNGSIVGGIIGAVLYLLLNL